MPLEKILATDGRLLVGFDVKRVLGKSALSLRDAVSPPFHVESDCTKVGCAAYGPSPPGGKPVRIGMLPNASPDIVVTIQITRELVPRVHALFAASLGRGQQEGPSTTHVYHHDGVRYRVVHDDDGAVTVTISSE